MSTKRAFEIKDIEFPEMFHWQGRFLQYRKGTRLAKAAAKDRRHLNAICYLDEKTDKQVRELQETCLAEMGVTSPEQMVAVIEDSLRLIHKNRKARWAKKWN